MGKDTEHTSAALLENCLFFTAGALARAVGRLAEEEFHKVGFAPNHAFLLTLATEDPGVSVKALAERLHLAPSTVSRFVDALSARGLVEKRQEGRGVRVFATEAGRAAKAEVFAAWRRVYERYVAAMGEEAALDLTGRTARACGLLDRA